MLSKKELLYTLALQRVPNLGDTSAKKLIQVVGSAEGIFKEKKSRLLKIEGIGQIKLKELSLDLHLPEAEAELSFIEDHKIKIEKQQTDKASGNQKLKDLGLTDDEISALVG
mgnify:CR=1 FL=1